MPGQPGPQQQPGGYGYPQPPQHGAPPQQGPGGYGYPQPPQHGGPPEQHQGGYGYPPPGPGGQGGGPVPPQGQGPATGAPPHAAGPQAPTAPHGGPQQPPSGDWTLPPPGAPGAPGQPGPPPGAGGPGGPGGPPMPGQPGPQQQAPQHQQPPQAGPPQSGAWTAVVAPDREYFATMMQRSGPEAAALNLPAYSAEHELPLTGHQVSIGRRRNSTGEAPDIDLGRPPEDPGVSHQHALLVAQPDGSWSVVDQNSTNGTTVNGGEDPIQPYVPVPLRDGDQVHVGAWTTITIRQG